MSGRSILMAVALGLWLLIFTVVFATVAYVGLLGVGVAGLIMWFIWTLVEFDTDAVVGAEPSAGFPTPQSAQKAGRSCEDDMDPLGEWLLALQSVHFLKGLGALLAAIGLGGYLLF